MLGLHGIGLSGLTKLRDELGVSLRHVALWIAAPAFIALVCPNTLQILSPYEPALGWKQSPPDRAAETPNPMEAVASVGRCDIDHRRYRDS